MKSLIVYVSKTGNTKKVAEAIARGLGCEAKEVSSHPDLSGCHLVGFGSGVYYSRPAEELAAFIREINTTRLKAFVFVTYGGRWQSTVENLKRLLSEKGIEIVGEFKAPGLDKYGPLKLVGGIKKGRPNANDLKEAEEFGRSLMEVAKIESDS